MKDLENVKTKELYTRVITVSIKNKTISKKNIIGENSLFYVAFIIL